MTSKYLPFERAFDEETPSWCLIAHDRSGEGFDVGAADDPDEEVVPLLAAAGENRLGDLLMAALAIKTASCSDRPI
jgi:hypothetical protein